MIEKKDSLQFIREQEDFSTDVIYADPPYALGSEIVIREDGKPDYKKAVDFMSKWDMPTGDYWEEWFKEAFRVMKYGGHLLMFGIDRQNFLFKYYAHLARFQEKQSIYWYFISNFPKASNLSKMIDKSAGVEPIGIAKKYSGYKYSVAPLKQVVEEIMIFQKPYKTGSCLHDTLAMEGGNKEIACGAVDVDGNRVELQQGEDISVSGRSGENIDTRGQGWGFRRVDRDNSGRYPAQAFIDKEVAEVIGEQSKILHKCNFEKEEHDLFIYNPKVSKSERNAGLDGFEEKLGDVLNGTENQSLLTGSGNIRNNKMKNNHPTLKPIALNEKVLRLFKTPDKQKILYPFAGVGSEVIGGIKAGFNNWSGCEINKDYVEIGNARIEYWSKMEQLKLV